MRGEGEKSDAVYLSTHSGLVGGGLEIFGSNFFCCFFGLIWYHFICKGGEKYK